AVNVDALHGDAALSGEGERVCGHRLRGGIEVGVRLDDHGRRVAELEVDALLGRTLPQLPADRAGAGEGQRADALVLDQHVAELGRRPDDDVDPTGREA